MNFSDFKFLKIKNAQMDVFIFRLNRTDSIYHFLFDIPYKMVNILLYPGLHILSLAAADQITTFSTSNAGFFEIHSSLFDNLICKIRICNDILPNNIPSHSPSSTAPAV